MTATGSVLSPDHGIIDCGSGIIHHNGLLMAGIDRLRLPISGTGEHYSLDITEYNTAGLNNGFGGTTACSVVL